jgi:hypothetical protein
MATYEVTSPDGKTWEVTAPDGASQDQVLAYAKQQWTAQIKEPPAAVKAGGALKDIPRQLGLTGRYAVEGLAGVGDMLAAPIRLGLNAMGANIKPAAQALGASMDEAGVPQPQGANERVIGDAARLVAGAGGMAGGANALGAGVTGLTQRVLAQLAANPGTQGIAAATAGASGGSVREAGGGPGAQFAASLLGGLAGGAGAGVAQSAGNNLSARLRALVSGQPAQQVEQQIELALRGTGMEWSQLPERLRQSMRAEVQQAMQTGGPLNPDAIRRLADFRSVPGATPTRGMLTQDPVQITREMNLAKTGANSTDLGLQRLPQIQNQNAQALLSALDGAGARNAPDAYATGQRVIGALQGRLDASRGRIDTLYQDARDTQGRSAPLDGAAFTSRASQLLDEGLLGGALPKSVEQHLNRIAQGEVPFTVDYAEQLKTAMGKLQRGTNDGQARMALGVVRQALEETPLRAAPQVNPGNLPAVPGTAPQSPATLGADSIAAFNRARTANRAFMNRVENTPALRAVMDGAEPDKFVQQYVTGGGASLNDVRQMARSMADRPEALEAVKSHIAAHLRGAATNGTEDVAKWSSAAYNRALNSIGERKLGVFFSPDEVRQLQAIGRVGTLMQAQPAGTAVNNSNSAAMLLGRLTDRLTDRAPLISEFLQGTIRGRQQGAALNVPAALRGPSQQAQMPLLQRMGAAPMLYGTGLLGLPPEAFDARQDQR